MSTKAPVATTPVAVAPGADAHAAQNTLHRALAGYVNDDRLLVPLLPDRQRQRARALVAAYAELSKAQQREGASAAASNRPTEIIAVQPYAGVNPHVRGLQLYLTRHLQRDLLGAYVHGSLGSYEEVAYSDLDALVILKDEALQTPERLRRVACALSRARAFMYAHDPLQHHGWFVLTALDLSHYCDAYFPSVLFRHAASLLPGAGERLMLRHRDATREVANAFLVLSADVLRQLEGRAFPSGLYALKNLLSQFMLLPALYVQVRDGEGVWKPDGFGRARDDFAPALWASVDGVSALRRAWPVAPLPPVRRRIMTSARPWGRLARKHVRVPVPPALAALLTPELHERMSLLVNRMRERLDEACAVGSEPER